MTDNVESDAIRCEHGRPDHVRCSVCTGDPITVVPVEQDLWWGYLCPALANIGALKHAQRDLVALGADWAEAGRILSRVQSFYVNAAHEAAQRYLAATTEPPADGVTLYLDILESTNPSPKVRAVIDQIRAEHATTPGSRVHNHPPHRPACNERDVDGHLRGACLNDDGSDR